MSILILGGGGMLGRSLAEGALARELDFESLAHSDLDVTDTEAVEAVFEDFEPRWVINAAAYTNVDGCETETERAFEVNGHAVGRLARAAEKRGMRLVQISSDYVFDGTADVPYLEGASTAPISAYGESKLLGEREALTASGALVVRTSWLFGPGGRNFVDTMARLGRERDELRVVDDQRGAPTFTPHLANAVFDLISVDASGIVHYRDDEPATWFDLASAVVEVWGLEARVVPVTTAEFPRPAARPAYSVLDVGRFQELAKRPVERWYEGLATYRRLEAA